MLVRYVNLNISKDALRTYALEQSANVAASINASLPVGNNSYGFVPVGEPTAEGISNTIAGMNLSVDVANPNDGLFVWAGAYNADGDPLFTGYHQFWLVNGKGGYALPPDYGNVTLTLFDNIPIKVNADAQSAIIDILNDAGVTTAEYSLNVQNGKVYFPRQLAGTNAMLAVYISGGKGVGPGWLYWNVSSGSQVTPEHFDVALKSTIQGVVSLTDTNVYVTVPTTNSVGYNLTAELKSTSKQWLGVSFSTSEGRLFKGAWVRKAGDALWTPYAPTGGTKYFLLPVEQAIYYIIPVWNDGDLVEPADPWYPPYDGGGKG
ncbi:MAG: hypothetical protein KGJ33_00530 [Patescibacteria group bacterium]|nr:hypothetical protein [Patescibacteria group bacterium]